MSREVDEGRRSLMRAAAMTIGAERLRTMGTLGALMQQLACTAQAAERGMPSLGGATGWLNSPALTPEGLRGKVVLVQFWTYTCINWLRTMPYVRAWAAKYSPRGLVVLGVHSPEFEFEKSADLVRRAVTAMRIDYPVALDADHDVWDAFRNEYWPALYLVDARGRIRHHHFGEGEYGESERYVQRLLAEAGAADVDRELVRADARGVELDADWGSLRTPETYLGTARAENFASPGGLVASQRRGYDAPPRLGRNEWALSGEWSVGRQKAVVERRGGRITCAFHARDLHLVMGAAAGRAPVPFRVRIDGQAPGAAHGLDVDERGEGAAAEPRLYQLLRQPSPIGDRRFEIEFLEPGAEAYCFTFG